MEIKNDLPPMLHILVKTDDGKKDLFTYELKHNLHTRKSLDDFANAFAAWSEHNPNVAAWFTLGELQYTDNEV